MNPKKTIPKKSADTNWLLAFTLSCLVPATALAGGSGREGHGGTLLVCDQTTEDPAFRGRTMLADFAELAFHSGFRDRMRIVESDESVDAQIEKALQRIQAADNIQKNTRLINQLSPTHQAGLWVHEGVYKLTRKYLRTPTAELARRITAYLFSDMNDPIVTEMMVKDHLISRSSYRELYPTRYVPVGNTSLNVVIPECLKPYLDGRSYRVLNADGHDLDPEAGGSGSKFGSVTNDFSFHFEKAAAIMIHSSRFGQPLFPSDESLERFLGECTPYVELNGRRTRFFAKIDSEHVATFDVLVKVAPEREIYDAYMEGKTPPL